MPENKVRTVNRLDMFERGCLFQDYIGKRIKDEQ